MANLHRNVQICYPDHCFDLEPDIMCRATAVSRDSAHIDRCFYSQILLGITVRYGNIGGFYLGDHKKYFYAPRIIRIDFPRCNLTGLLKINAGRRGFRAAFLNDMQKLRQKIYRSITLY